MARFIYGEKTMIKDFEHAKAVQERRVKAGKRGYAKAVRRFLLRDNGPNYAALKPHLPVVWQEKKKAE